MTISAGYVTTWNGVTIVDGNTKKATTYTGRGTEALPRLFQIGNGVWLNYDQGNAATTEGKIKQEVLLTAGSGLMDTMLLQLGREGALVLTDNDGVTTETNTSAMLLVVADTTPVQGTRANVWVEMTWQILGTW